MTKRILLSEMPAVANELIQLEQLKYNNGQMILKMLSRLGLNLTKVDDWQAIEQELMSDFPKATLLFNVQANGIEAEYKEVEAFYLKNRYALGFETVTPEYIEDIKEKCKVYADSPAQIEAHELIHKTTDNLNRLIEMGIKIDVNQIYQVSRLFYGDSRAQPPLKVYQSHLVSTLVNLK